MKVRIFCHRTVLVVGFRLIRTGVVFSFMDLGVRVAVGGTLSGLSHERCSSLAWGLLGQKNVKTLNP